MSTAWAAVEETGDESGLTTSQKSYQRTSKISSVKEVYERINGWLKKQALLLCQTAWKYCIIP